ncbi:DUF6779 domain-containing protein [Nocardia sp. 004]|uniref:DUF6779 domain-containing protein n=1 Tax=Nocardia sp. 004 TaxID=3385978 RepID=UPI0039A39CC9
MVSPSRSSASSRQRDDAGRFFIGVLIVLGLVASVFLIFSDNVQLVRTGLVVALWAAAIGALAATRYRKEATIDKAKVRDMQTVYELQLEREVTARREYELGIEARIREEVGADVAELVALRAELTVLRKSLQRLYDGELPMDRPALRADATRIHELTSSNTESADNGSADAEAWPASAEQQRGGSFTPIFQADHPERPIFASPFDEPVTAETTIVSSDIDDSELTDAEQAWFTQSRGWIDAFAGSMDESPDEPRSQQARRPESERVGRPGSKDAGRPESKAERSEPNQAGQPEPRQESTRQSLPATPVGTSGNGRRHRRRADDNTEASEQRLSVAEIMANLQSEGRQQR